MSQTLSNLPSIHQVVKELGVPSRAVGRHEEAAGSAGTGLALSFSLAQSFLPMSVFSAGTSGHAF